MSSERRPKRDKVSWKNGYAKLANELTEAIASGGFDGVESAILFSLIRHTYGWHSSDRAKYSVSIAAKDTARNRSTVGRSFSRLVKQGVIKCFTDPQPGGIPGEYGLNEKYHEWKRVPVPPERDSNEDFAVPPERDEPIPPCEDEPVPPGQDSKNPVPVPPGQDSKNPEMGQQKLNTGTGLCHPCWDSNRSPVGQQRAENDVQEGVFSPLKKPERETIYTCSMQQQDPEISTFSDFDQFRFKIQAHLTHRVSPGGVSGVSQRKICAILENTALSHLNPKDYRDLLWQSLEEAIEYTIMAQRNGERFRSADGIAVKKWGELAAVALSRLRDRKQAVAVAAEDDDFAPLQF